MNLLNQMILLYAEDEVDIQKHYSNYFKHYFKFVHTAVNGKEALAKYREIEPDVVILDINMPYLSGLEVAKKIREDGSDVCIILLTARTDKKALIEAVELGLVTYLEKPICRGSLKKALVKLNQKVESKNSINLWFYKNNYYIWDKIRQQLFYRQQQIALTKQEIILLEILIANNGAKVSYQDIYEEVWFNEDREYKESTIKTLISTLRVKLPPKAIENVYGMGYYLNLQTIS